ncbi:MAG: DsbA family protein [SAR324 cluster bacterium]|nr:DsbA family protein [SAR324 cluster bacterium]
MKFNLKIIGITIAILLFLVPAAFGQIKGIFDEIGDIPEKHTLDVVILEEFLNFTCPHCNNFRKFSKPLFKKYGARLKKINIPITFRGQSDQVLRLYFIAEKAGVGDAVKEAIFDATFSSGYNVNDPRVIGFLARSAGIWDQFKRDANSDWVNVKILRATQRADSVGVRGTPTIVLNGALRMAPRRGMGIFVKNLDNIIGQLLKPSS